MLKEEHRIVRLFTYGDCDNKRYNFNHRAIRLVESKKTTITTSKVVRDDMEQLKSEGCELIISAGYPYRIPVLDGTIRGINIHPTLLPEGKGPWPLPWVILKGLTKSGVTIHKLTNELDSGDILSQAQFDITPFDNLESISCKVQMLAAKLLCEIMKDFEYYWSNAIAQKGGGSYWKMPADSDRTLHWTDNIEDIFRTARAFGKFDSFAVFEGKEWIVQDLTVWKENHNHQCGSVVHKTNGEVVIAAKNGFVCLRIFEIDPDFQGE